MLASLGRGQVGVIFVAHMVSRQPCVPRSWSPHNRQWLSLHVAPGPSAVLALGKHGDDYQGPCGHPVAATGCPCCWALVATSEEKWAGVQPREPQQQVGPWVGSRAGVDSASLGPGGHTSPARSRGAQPRKHLAQDPPPRQRPPEARAPQHERLLWTTARRRPGRL